MNLANNTMIGKANFFAKLIPFILIVFFTSPQSFAKSKCDEQLTLTIDNHAVNISLSKLEKHYTSAIERVRQVVENANLIFPSSPVMITIHPNFNFEGPIASIDVLDITVPYQRLFEMQPHQSVPIWRNYGRHPNKSLPSFFHELGHAILQVNIIGSNSPAGYYFALAIETRKLAAEADEILKTYQNSDESIILEKLGKLPEKFQQKDQEFTNLQKSHFGRYIEGLNELFADVIAVLASQDPQITLNSVPVRPTNSISKQQRFLARDFTNPINFIDHWKGPDGDTHNDFSPVRYHLYQSYLRYPMYMSGKKQGEFLSLVLNSIIEFSKIPAINLEDMDIIKANRTMIELIDRLHESQKTPH